MCCSTCSWPSRRRPRDDDHNGGGRPRRTLWSCSRSGRRRRTGWPKRPVPPLFCTYALDDKDTLHIKHCIIRTLCIYPIVSSAYMQIPYYFSGLYAKRGIYDSLTAQATRAVENEDHTAWNAAFRWSAAHHAWWPWTASSTTRPRSHAKNKIAGRTLPFLVLGFSHGRETPGYAPAPSHPTGIYPATTRI